MLCQGKLLVMGLALLVQMQVVGKVGWELFPRAFYCRSPSSSLLAAGEHADLPTKRRLIDKASAPVAPLLLFCCGWIGKVTQRILATSHQPYPLEGFSLMESRFFYV